MGKSTADTTGNSDESNRTLDASTSVDKVGATDQGQMGSQAFPEPKADAIVEARKDGVIDAIKESTKDAYKRGANEGYGDAPGPDGDKRQIVVDANVFGLADQLDLSADALAERIDEKAVPAITEGKIAGLLEMERSGKNRTEHVRVLCKRLGVKSPTEVTDAGPAYTNDTTQTDKLI